MLFNICIIEKLAPKQYTDAYFELVKTIKQKIIIVESYNLVLFDINSHEYQHDKELMKTRNDCIRKLKDAGWKDNEIEFYNKIRTTILELKNIFDLNFINILTMRYALINDIKLPDNFRFDRSHELPTKEGKAIISNILLIIINEKIQYILDNLGEEIFYGYRVRKDIITKDDDFIQEYEIGTSFQWFFEIYKIFKIGSITFTIKDELKKMLISYLFLLRPLVENLDTRILDFIDLVRIQNEELPNYKLTEQKNIIIKNYVELKLESMEYFLQTYKEYCDIIGYNSYELNHIDDLLKDPSSLPTDLSPYSFQKRM